MITTITGSNSYAVNDSLQKLISSFVQENGDFGLDRVDASEKDFESIVDSIGGLPFLSPKKMVVLKDASSNKEFSEKIEQLAKQIPDTNEVIIVEAKLDKRSKYYSYLKKSTEFNEFNELDENGLVNWIKKYAQDAGGEISATDAKYLVELVGVNQLRVTKELDKLLTYEPKINRDSIDELVEPTPQTTIFQLLDATFNNEEERIIKIYKEQRTQKVEPQQVIAMLTWQFGVLSIVKTAESSDVNKIAKDANLNPFVVRKTMSLSRKISYHQLKELVRELLKLDVTLKTKPINADQALINYLLQVGS